MKKALKGFREENLYFLLYTSCNHSIEKTQLAEHHHSMSHVTPGRLNVVEMLCECSDGVFCCLCFSGDAISYYMSRRLCFCQCVSVCLSVSKITQKALNRFWLGFHGTFGEYTLVKILIPINQDRAVFHSMTITCSTMFRTFGLSLLFVVSFVGCI